MRRALLAAATVAGALAAAAPAQAESVFVLAQTQSVEMTDAPDISAKVRRVKRGRAVVTTSATPATPGARVVLQLRLRERFGWWPVDRARLDRRGRARFSVRGNAGAPARVVLVGPDWATVLNASRVRKLPH